MRLWVYGYVQMFVIVCADSEVLVMQMQLSHCPNSDIIEAHCYVVNVRRTARGQIRSRINNN